MCFRTHSHKTHKKHTFFLFSASKRKKTRSKNALFRPLKTCQKQAHLPPVFRLEKQTNRRNGWSAMFRTYDLQKGRACRHGVGEGFPSFGEGRCPRPPSRQTTALTAPRTGDAGRMFPISFVRRVSA